MRPERGTVVRKSWRTRGLLSWYAMSRMRTVAFGSSGSMMASVAGRSSVPSGFTRPSVLKRSASFVNTVTET